MQRVFNENLVGMKDKDGKLVVPVLYDYVWPPENGYAIVQKFCFYGLVRISDSKEIIPAQYTHIKAKSNYIIVANNQSYGICNLDGEIIVPTVLSKHALEELERIMSVS